MHFESTANILANFLAPNFRKRFLTLKSAAHLVILTDPSEVHSYCCMYVLSLRDCLSHLKYPARSFVIGPPVNIQWGGWARKCAGAHGLSSRDSWPEPTLVGADCFYALAGLLLLSSHRFIRQLLILASNY